MNTSHVSCNDIGAHVWVREVPSLNSGRFKKSGIPGISVNTDKGLPSGGRILDVGGALHTIGFVITGCFNALMCAS